MDNYTTHKHPMATPMARPASTLEFHFTPTP